jgi:hypothetical protein
MQSLAEIRLWLPIYLAPCQRLMRGAGVFVDTPNLTLQIITYGSRQHLLWKPGVDRICLYLPLESPGRVPGTPERWRQVVRALCVGDV